MRVSYNNGCLACFAGSKMHSTLRALKRDQRVCQASIKRSEASLLRKSSALTLVLKEPWKTAPQKRFFSVSLSRTPTTPTTTILIQMRRDMSRDVVNLPIEKQRAWKNRYKSTWPSIELQKAESEALPHTGVTTSYVRKGSLGSCTFLSLVWMELFGPFGYLYLEFGLWLILQTLASGVCKSRLCIAEGGVMRTMKWFSGLL